MADSTDRIPSERASVSGASTAAEEPGPEINNSEIKDEEHGEKAAAEPAKDADEPPNGGLQAWLQVLASFFLFFNTWGFINTFGVFQDYYDQELPRSPSDVSWIGTFQAFLLLFISVVAGPLYDKGYLRHMLAVGSFLIVLGMMMTSLATEYYQFFLAQGLVIGLGSGLLQIPSLAFGAQYFTTKRALAIGIAASGGSVGALIYPIVFRKLRVQTSFGWATRAIGFIALGTLLISNFLMKPRVKPSKVARTLIDLSALKNPPFVVFTFALFLIFMGVYVPFFYITSYAQTHTQAGEDLSFYLLSILNAGSIFGRILPGFLGDRLGSLNLLLIMITITGIMVFAWISITQTGELIAFCIFYGFFSGASVSLPATVITGVIPDLSKVGTWLGMCFCLAGLGLLIGNPVVGAILYANKDGSYIGAQVFSGAVVLGGAAGLCVLRYMRFRAGFTWTKKV